MSNPNFVPNFSSNEIYRDTDDTRCLTDDLDTIESDITALESSKANAEHTHSDYAASVHTHSQYADIDHAHSEYASSTHTHTGYAEVDHSHTEYVTAEHTHSGYALENHEHTSYASTSHSHSEYAEATHTHDGYASFSHTHSYNDLEDKPTIPTALPANGGNADTVDGKHASEFASASDMVALQTQVGDTSVADQISTAVVSKANVVHTHAIADVADLVDTLNSKYEKPSTGIAKSDLASDVQASLGKADTAIQSLFGYATESYVDTKVAGLVDSAPDALNTLNELAAALGDNANFATTVTTQLGGKVDKVEGKELSSNDYTDAEKTKLAGVATGANKTVIDSVLSTSSTNPVQNKVIQSALAGKADADHVHNTFGSLTEIGITTFPTTMSAVASAMPANSMIVIDTRRVNGSGTGYDTEIISDWNNATNGMAFIMKGVTTARVTMMILYGSSESDHGDFTVGNYATTNNTVSWTTSDDFLDGKVNKIINKAAVNLNTLIEPGFYYVSSGTTDLNFPIGVNGHLLVMSDGDNRVRQVFMRLGTANTNCFQWYSRTLHTSTWSNWWLISGQEKVWNGGAVLNDEINIGSRYGCQSWIVVARLQNTGAMSSVVIPRAFLTNDTDLYKFQIADETCFISFYIYYKSDNNVYLKVVDQSDNEYTTLKYVYRTT